MERRDRRRRGSTLLFVLLVGGLYAWYQWESRGPDRRAVVDAARGGEQIAEVFRERRSGVWVEGRGVVTAVLPDDERGSRHQRFILTLPDGQTLLVSHNIDLAPRVPIEKADEVAFRGEYEWNEKGGVIHWTHHDPSGRRLGGWLRHRGEAYR